MALIPKWNAIVSLAGGASGTEEATVFASPARGEITAVTIRADGGATSLTEFWLVHTPATALGSTVPKSEYVIIQGTAITLTASGTEHSLRTRIAIPPSFNKGLGIIATTVSTGAYTLEFNFEIIDLNGSGIT